MATDAAREGPRARLAERGIAGSMSCKGHGWDDVCRGASTMTLKVQ